MFEQKDFLAIDDYSPAELRAILDLAREQKPLARSHSLPHTHANRTLACVFAKPSLRTRVSFEVGFRQLGGNTLFITDKEIGMGTRESVKDVAKVLSRFVDGIMIRWFDQGEVDELAERRAVGLLSLLQALAHLPKVFDEPGKFVVQQSSAAGDLLRADDRDTARGLPDRCFVAGRRDDDGCLLAGAGNGCRPQQQETGC